MSKNSKFKLRIKEEYRNLLPPLPPAEYEALKNSIRINGLLNPIDVNPEGFILDGIHRYRACMELGIEPKYIIKKFDDPLQEKRFVIECNLMRRQMTTFQRIETALPLIEIERELAKKRMLAGNPVPNLDKGRTTEIVAKKIGISHGLLEMALWLIENAPEEELDKVRYGEKSISRLYREIKNSMEKKEMEGSIPRFLARLLKSAPTRWNNKLKINRYKNSKFATIMVDESIIDKFERGCSTVNEELGQPIDLELVIMDALEEYWRRFDRALQSIKKTKSPQGE